MVKNQLFEGIMIAIIILLLICMFSMFIPSLKQYCILNCLQTPLADIGGGGGGSPTGTDQPGQTDTIECTDSDGGIVKDVFGKVTDPIRMIENVDRCQDHYYLEERYCNQGSIATTVINCWATKQSCFEGRCVSMGCSSIIRPNSQSDCDVGVCSAGGCVYEPATAFSVSRCICA